MKGSMMGRPIESVNLLSDQERNDVINAYNDTAADYPSDQTIIVECFVDEVGDWRVAILSLSENGCLVRSAESLPLGAPVELRFDLPRCEGLQVAAETGYQLLPDLGLLFGEIPAPTRQAIRRFVSFALDR